MGVYTFTRCHCQIGRCKNTILRTNSHTLRNKVIIQIQTVDCNIVLFNPNRSLEIFRAKSQIIAGCSIVIASIY